MEIGFDLVCSLCRFELFYKDVFFIIIQLHRTTQSSKFDINYDFGFQEL